MDRVIRNVINRTPDPGVEPERGIHQGYIMSPWEWSRPGTPEWGTSGPRSLEPRKIGLGVPIVEAPKLKRPEERMLVTEETRMEAARTPQLMTLKLRELGGEAVSMVLKPPRLEMTEVMEPEPWMSGGKLTGMPALAIPEQKMLISAGELGTATEFFPSKTSVTRSSGNYRSFPPVGIAREVAQVDSRKEKSKNHGGGKDEVGDHLNWRIEEPNKTSSEVVTVSDKQENMNMSGQK